MKKTKRTEKPTTPHRLVVQATFKVDHTMPIVLAELSLYDPLLERIQALHVGLKLLKAFSIQDKMTANQVSWHCEDGDRCDKDMYPILTMIRNTIFVESELRTGPESFPIPISVLEAAITGQQLPCGASKREDDVLFYANDCASLRRLIADYRRIVATRRLAA